jgi:hypothetical protein
MTRVVYVPLVVVAVAVVVAMAVAVLKVVLMLLAGCTHCGFGGFVKWCVE